MRYNKVKKENEKRFFIKGLIISIIEMIIIIIVLNITLVKNYEALGMISFYCVIGVVITSIISKKKKMNIFLLILLSTGIQILSILFGFIMMSISL